MTPAALALVLAAAVLHATWNALTKRAADPFAFLWSAMLVAAVLMAPVAAAAGAEPDAWRQAALPIVGSGIVHGAYYVALAAAYRRGDLSLVYPIARGLGVALVPAVAALAIDERIGLGGGLGIALVVAGIATGARPRPGAAPVDRGAVGLALATGVLIAVYSVIDRTGVQALSPLPFVVSANGLAVALSAPVAWARRDAVRAEWAAHGRIIVVASFFTLAGYALVLFAFRLAPTAYVAAAREVSIALAAAIGMGILGEPRSARRIAGALLVVAGVVVLALLG